MALDACTEWRGTKTGLGYGQRMVGGKVEYAHRIAYCQANGLTLADIKGLVVRHRCDNPICHNPNHLLLGTQADNMRDMWGRGRGKTNPHKGEANGSAKLTDDDVRQIRALYVRGSSDMGLKGVAAMFGIDQSQVSHIVNRQQWAHVGDGHAQ